MIIRVTNKGKFKPLESGPFLNMGRKASLSLGATLRSILSLIFYPFFFFFCSVLVIFASLFGKQSEDQIVVFWGKVSCWMFGVEPVLNGQFFPPGKSCLYVFNHTSFFDIFAMHSFNGFFRFGAKIELFSIPIFGYAMRKSGALPIIRQSRNETMKVYQDAILKTEQGMQYALAPEGGRNPEETLLPFKAGPFIFAINAQIPVVPVVIKGAHEVLGKKGFIPNSKKLKTQISVTVLDPIPTAGLTLESRQDLQKKAFEAMKVYFS